MSDGFPKAGVKIVYVTGEFVDILGGIDAIRGLTTAQVCEKHIKPLTQKAKSSYCDLLKQQGHPAYVEKADAFISHAHAYLFEDFVSALKWRLRDEPDSSVWLDLFSINQHEPMDWTFKWLSTTFKSNVARIGRTVMVMSPWDDPLPYSRSWCVFEAYSTAESGGQFEIAMSENDEAVFLKDIQEDPEGRINRILTTIRAENSKCSKESDKNAIFKVIRDTIGFAKLDSMVFERYREWVVEVSLKALQALDNDKERLGLLGVVGVLYLGQGKYKEAESFGTQFLEISKRVLGPEHPNSLTAMNNLALAFDKEGEYAKAEDLYRVCLQRRKSALGEDHADTLLTLNNLAVNLSNQGRYAEAEELYKDCLQRQKTTFGDDHPETLRAMNNVAVVYETQELYPLAEDLYRRCLERRQATLDNDHPDTLLTTNNLAGTLASQRKYTEAEDLFRSSLERQIAILGDDHPETIRTKRHLDKTIDRRTYDTGSVQSRHSSTSGQNSVHSRSGSIRSRRSIRRDSLHSTRSHQGDGASVVSRHSLQSVSQQIRSLPREIELVDDAPGNCRQHDESSNKKYNGSPLPKCCCSWKHCRTYQKTLREYKHPVFNGVIKLKFFKENGKSMALKAAVDRALQVGAAKKDDWKTLDGKAFCRYYVARHHFTEALIKEYLADRRSWDWNEPLPIKKAKTLLWDLDPQDIYASDDEKNCSNQTEVKHDVTKLFVKAPNVPKEPVRELLKKIKKSKAIGQKGLEKTLSSTSVTDTLKDNAGLKDSVLAQKEIENLRLREELNECNEQISTLHSMVKQLKFDLDQNRSSSETKKKKLPKKAAVAAAAAEDSSNEEERSSQKQSSDSDETISIEYVDCQHNSVRTRRSRSLRRSSIRSSSSSICSRSRNSSPRHSLKSERDDGDSAASKLSVGGSANGHRDKDDCSFFDDSCRKLDDDSQSVNTRRSATSQTSQSSHRSVTFSPSIERLPSIKSLPREIELMDDEEEDTSDELEDETYANVSTDTLFVTDKQIVDAYGEKGVYTGTFSKSTGMPNGKGRLEYEKEGRWYEGDWIHGRWTGYSHLSNGDGGFYEGGFKNDRKHGQGIMRFADGRVFEGEYIRDQMIQGKMTYQDGSVYGGSWVDGMRHGRGKCIFVDGAEYEGEFREGKHNGHGKMTWNDGGWYIGEWCDGEMHGRGKEIRLDGSLRHDGEWSRGQPVRAGKGV